LPKCFPKASRAIIIGYADIKMPKEVLQAIEDIRLAFFKAAYLQRNQSLFEHVQIDGVALFFKFLSTYFQTRFNLAELNGDSAVWLYRTIVEKDGALVTVNPP